MFGKVMSIHDNLIIQYFELATRVSADEVKNIENTLKEGGSPRDIKIRLAFEIVKTYHGEKEAQKARDEWDNVCSKGEYPSEMKEVKPDKLVELVGMVTQGSSSSAKILIDEGAVRVNGEVKKEWNFMPKEGDVVQIGPKTFVKVK
jgi:tyrosyl-tRNA synthetase